MAPVEQATIAIYERWAREWAARRGPAHDDMAARFRDLAGAGPVLDAGCGAGRHLAQLGQPTVGLDATAALLLLARSESAGPLVRADLEQLPFASGAFTGAFARHTYLHIPKARLGPALRELRRVLATGSPVLMTMIPGSEEGSRLEGDDFPGRWFSLFEASELAAALTRAGLVDVDVRRVGPTGRPDLVASARAG